jgi:cation diffusion facilitator CzcD-associated flavoprotein CzcO
MLPVQKTNAFLGELITVTVLTESEQQATAIRERHVHVAVIGSGFAGLGMAIRLKQAGIADFVVLERGDEVGGTWRDNSYPGAACDVPSRLYSFSFAPNPDWTRSFSPQPEILDYLRDCAERFGVRDHVRFGCGLEHATWEEDGQRWRLQTADGELTASVLISAAGALSQPRLPDIGGIDRFAGTVFHSAAWNHDHDVTGERVAVIGTGASAIQIVPELVPKAASLDVYQRTPAWIVPRTDRAFTRLERFLYRRVPALERLARAAIYWAREGYVVGFTRKVGLMGVPEKIARRHLASQVPDRELRRKLTPGYTIGCKRILISNDFYPALSRPNADVVTSPIAEVREHSIVTADGEEREVDTIVLATGFQVTPPPIADAISGREGRTLAETWADSGMQAHRGTAIAGFPNLFMLVGPNTGLGHTSMVYVIEAQIAYVMDALRTLQRDGIAVVEPRAEAQQRFNARVQKDLKGTVWQTGGCASWYLDAHGNNTTLWPDFTFRFKRLTQRFDRHNYELVPAGAETAAPAVTASR